MRTCPGRESRVALEVAEHRSQHRPVALVERAFVGEVHGGGVRAEVLAQPVELLGAERRQHALLALHAVADERAHGVDEAVRAAIHQRAVPRRRVAARHHGSRSLTLWSCHALGAGKRPTRSTRPD
jgi:hypothetical protein